MYEHTTESAEIKTQTQWNLISPRVTAPLLELWPSSVLLLPSTYCPSIQTTKNLDHISNRLVFQVLNYFFNKDTAYVGEYLCILTELKMYEG